MVNGENENIDGESSQLEKIRILNRGFNITCKFSVKSFCVLFECGHCTGHQYIFYYNFFPEFLLMVVTENGLGNAIVCAILYIYIYF